MLHPHRRSLDLSHLRASQLYLTQPQIVFIPYSDFTIVPCTGPDRLPPIVHYGVSSCTLYNRVPSCTLPNRVLDLSLFIDVLLDRLLTFDMSNRGGEFLFRSEVIVN